MCRIIGDIIIMTVNIFRGKLRSKKNYFSTTVLFLVQVFIIKDIIEI